LKLKFENIKILIYFLLAVVLLSSCQATSYLQKDETFLCKNKIKIKSSEKIVDKALLNEELLTFYEQNPNENFLWVNRQWFYYITREKSNNWFIKFIKKSFAQEPAIYDELKAHSTSIKLETFLKYKRGFYNAKVSYKSEKISKYNTEVTYQIDAGHRFLINDYKIICEDTVINAIIEKNKSKSFIIKGEPVNSANYDLEKIRISNLLQDNGYAAFNMDYFELKGDSSKNLVNLELLIKTPKDTHRNPIYKIGEIKVFTDYYPSQDIDKLRSDSINNIILLRETEDFLIDPDIIVNAISITKGEVYSKNKNKEIYGRLSKFPIFKFISIKTSVDSLNQDVLNYNIFMYINEYKYSYEGETNIKYLKLSTDENFFNTGLNLNIFNKIVSNKGDNMVFDGSGDLKINLKGGNSQEINFATKLDYIMPRSPKTIVATPLSLILKMNGLDSKQFKEIIKTKTNSNLSLSFNYLNSLDYYISSLNLNYGYKYLNNEQGIVMLFNQAGLDLVNTKIIKDSLFNDFQKKSLKDYFQTGILFKNLNLDFKKSLPGDRFFFNYLLALEISGAELFFINSIYNKISSTNDIWKYNKSVDFAKFIKAVVEIRPKFKINKTDEIATRFYGGIGIAYAEGQSLPYIKQFESGGPTSMRAWTARSLGPGSYHDESIINDDSPYQKGDIRLEANIEYRFKLSSYFRYALFLDAGNIWTLKNDPERIGAQFKSDFYKQVAVNAGISLQLDIFLLLRFDLAFKLRNPYLNENGKYWDYNSFKPNFVFSINNPF
jgi:outer membrane protein insertion porin family